MPKLPKIMLSLCFIKLAHFAARLTGYNFIRLSGKNKLYWLRKPLPQGFLW